MRRRFFLLSALGGILPQLGWGKGGVTVAAAADLKFALEELLPQFERVEGVRVRVAFGSSGNLFVQAMQGAPFELFLSADEEFVFRLAAAGKTIGRGAVYAVGRIGVFVPEGSTLRADGSLRDLAAALRERRLQRFAIANPEHAPYGKRAMEALQYVGLWEQVRPFLVFGENVSQALQFVLSGGANGGIVAWSLARAPQVATRGAFDLIPAEWHQPLVQRMALLRGASRGAEALFAFLQSAPAREVLARYGFVVPEKEGSVD
ncbi:MAG: molybdate ABC transporter substrate-binding protein [Hydrogenophilus sp.]|nr:molybdate ABC transporter substrate-binding protein [Hydrogenophilus sp.]